MKNTWFTKHKQERTFGQRCADGVANGMGSWKFIIIQTCIVAGWICLNIFFLVHHPFDRYPFILLNLLFSTQAAYAAPIIMMSQNRASERDRLKAEQDAEVDRHAAATVDKLEEIIGQMKEQQAKIMAAVCKED